MGYNLNHKGYKCLDSNGKLYISRDVIFDETTFPFAQTDQSSYSIQVPLHCPILPHLLVHLFSQSPLKLILILFHTHVLLLLPLTGQSMRDLSSVPNVHSISPVTNVVVQNIVSSGNTNLNRRTGQPRVQGEHSCHDNKKQKWHCQT